MSALNRRHFLQLGASSLAVAAWSNSCAAPPAQPSAASPTAASPTTTAATVAAAAGALPPNAPAGNVLRIALAALPNTLDPANFEIIEAYPFGFAVYDALVWVDRNLTPQPMLAERWEPSANQLSWRFHLRPNVAFHHGTILTAADVVYTFTRLLDPAVGSVLQPILRFVELVEAEDEYTVRFQLKSRNVDLPLLLAAPQARILAHDYPAEQMLSQPSGTGPFLFVELLAGERITYARNPDYWAADAIHLEELHHIAIPTLEAQLTALQQGEIDLLLDVAGDRIEQLRAAPAINVVEIASGRYQNLAMRVSEAPFNDQRVRQALKACADRAILLQQAMNGHGSLGNDQPLAPINPYFAETASPIYQPEHARELLAAAGYPDGLQLQLITADASAGMVELAYAFQAMAQPAGITIDVVEVKVPGDIYLSEYWGRVPFYVSFSEFRPSAYETFATAYYSWSPWNETGWSSEQLDQLLDQASSTTNPERRKTLYQAAQQLIQDEGAVLIPYFQPVFSALRTTVQGFQPHPAGWVDLRGVQIVTPA